MESGKQSSHLYTFAHRRLRDAAFARGTQFPVLIRSGLMQKLLGAEWQLTADDLPTELRRSPDGLRADLRESKTHSIVVITMPTPAEPAEPYLVAVTVHKKSEETRYLTLEKTLDYSALFGESFGAGAPTTLCEWTRSIHANFGTRGIAPTLDEFTAAVERVLR